VARARAFLFPRIESRQREPRPGGSALEACAIRFLNRPTIPALTRLRLPDTITKWTACLADPACDFRACCPSLHLC
jgi:hypothetical protein